ncbi:hypothetical protein POM88_006561 [Heracleum sosnowskyi]|uniref:Uncharacterized protein n=1 Tax=Heracleum sosnowskyi TaxID=360622 RepID=A0AAD8J3W5_9APIA|nr:hypothetical protein POM88_006561 [Heracleum sosnowskyi]
MDRSWMRADRRTKEYQRGVEEFLMYAFEHRWFQEKIASDLLNEKKVPQEIRWIADGPNKEVPTFSGYRIDGSTFSTKDRDDTRQVQCSGVCVDADTMVVQDVDLLDEDMTSYMRDDLEELIQLS